jgi:hypothetical protein
MSTTKHSGSRPLNVSYLVVGLIFLGISGLWALHASGAVDTGDVQWLVPLVLVGAGVVGIVAFAARGLTRSRDDGPVDDEPGLDLYGSEPYEPYEPYRPYEPEHTDLEQADQTGQTEQPQQSNQPEQTKSIEGEDR